MMSENIKVKGKVGMASAFIPIFIGLGIGAVICVPMACEWQKRPKENKTPRTWGDFQAADPGRRYG